MSARPSAKLNTPPLRRVLLWSGVLCVVFGAGRFLARRNQPEYLGQPAWGGLSRLLRDGQCYWTETSRGLADAQAVKFALYTQPVQGGKRKTLLELRDPNLVVETEFVAGDYYYYTTRTTQEKLVSVPGAGGVGTVSRPPTQFLGRFLLETHPKKRTGEVRKPGKRFVVPPSPQGVLHRIFYRGGTPQTFPGTVPTQAGLCVLGDKAYWLEQPPQEVVQVWQSSRFREEVRSRNILWEKDLKTGRTRRIADGFDRFLRAGRTRLYWKRLRPYPDKRTDLYALSPQDGKITVLPDYGSNETPFENAGRLFWVENSLDSREEKGRPPVLWCARLDGSERRLLWKSPDGPVQHFAGQQGLKAYRGQVYFEYAILPFAQDSPAGNTVTTSGSTTCLASLHPERPEPLQRVYTLPEGGQGVRLDNGYLYFARQEEIESWAGWLSFHNQSRTEYAWYRVRFP